MKQKVTLRHPQSWGKVVVSFSKLVSDWGRRVWWWGRSCLLEIRISCNNAWWLSFSLYLERKPPSFPPHLVISSWVSSIKVVLCILYFTSWRELCLTSFCSLYVVWPSTLSSSPWHNSLLALFCFPLPVLAVELVLSLLCEWHSTLTSPPAYPFISLFCLPRLHQISAQL